MVLPRTLVGKFQENLGFYACTVSNFEQYTLAAFLQQGYFEKHINRMRNFYKNHRNQVIAKLKESRLWQMASIYEEDAGLHFLLHIDTQKEDSVIKDQLQQRGIRLRGMSDYTYDGSQVIPHTFIINYTAIDPQDLPEVLEEIYQVCIN
jgi:GntR family transcriptional regulator/MocR family aminotransferase